MIGGASFEMTDGRGEVMLPEWLCEALASDPHDAACRCPKIFPFSMAHRVKIVLAQEGFGQSREISQSLGVDLSRHHAACLDRRGIKCERILDLDPFSQEIRLEFPLDDDLPLFCRSGRGNTDEYDREHQHEVGYPSLVHAVMLAADDHDTLADGDKTMLVHLVYLVSFVQPEKPNKRDRPDRPNRPSEQDRLANFFSLLLGLQRSFFGQQHRMLHS